MATSDHHDQNFFEKVHNAFERIVLPPAEKLSGIPTIAAIRAALVLTLPFVLLGSLAALVNNFPSPAYKAFMFDHFGPTWTRFGASISGGTFAVMSLIILFSLGQHQAQQFNARYQTLRASPTIAGLVCFVSMLCLIQYDISIDAFDRKWLGVSGLFVAMLVGIISARLFLFLFKFKSLRMQLPGGTPSLSIMQAFHAFIPAMLTVIAFASFGWIFITLTGVSVHEGMHNLLRMPFDLIAGGLSRGLLYIFSLHSLWFCGIHGANILDPITHDIYGAAMQLNEAASVAGLPLPHVMTKTFMDVFIFMGGAGCMISLALALVLFGRTPANRKLGIISMVPGAFNISEVLLFGMPVILNPVMLLPFISTPLVLAVISYVAVSTGIVPGTSVDVEWTTPIFLNGYLATGSMRGPALQLFNMIVGILMYGPFVLLSVKMTERRTSAAFGRLLARACATANGPGKCSNHDDDAGTLARSLIIDLEEEKTRKNSLYLEFQPQVSSRTGEITGVESLIRWKHEFYGPIPAPITVALAEDSGQIIPIGLQIFNMACKIRREWLDCGINNLVMAVNVSALQLRPEFAEQLINIVKRYELPPQLLEIEITESSALDSDTPESRVITQLYDAGFPIAIDDFGMGHSSLKYLKQFPVTTVKIDGAISKEVVTNPICADIVASITRLCRARNMHSVAEFVETDEQVEILRELGCDIFQGYKFSKPLAANVCREFILGNMTQQIRNGNSSHAAMFSKQHD